MSKLHAKIIGLGKYLPEKVLTNADLEQMVDTSDEWITKRVGVKERRISDEHTFASDLAVRAAENALKDADMKAEDIELIIAASVSPDMYTPSISCLVQKQIGAVNAAAFDVNAACPGFIFAITTAAQYVENGMYKNVLVIGADTLSKITEYKDRSTCVLFGDGAGAAVVQATEEETGVISCFLGADGEHGDCLTIPGLRCDEIDKERRPFGNMHTIWMDGGAVFKFAVKMMAAATLKVVEDAGKTMDDVHLVVPHQANMRIIEGARKRLGIGEEKMFSNIERYGNMSAACVPIALCEAVEEGRAKKGDLVVIVSMGGGLTWGAVLIEL
ncbi:beta-ketoacyl-ACP synthase III [Ructibacterium gallinarum]|uniref:Beta-ketoacyl-[acyl-carrier-protein] synthase III n=1 Tax=Ructibacterium gallinarum TaxID=2779355 RepID=A0A9D5R7N9_9FIRM|nr:beta-ketoacyl-ACP synthase III [Ructibacterium gallinarum]MBE5039042.1 ketoacyl-ACP synthase III [Ructibacterium gallinarum]